MSALDGGAVWLVGSLSPAGPSGLFLSSISARRKVFSGVPRYPGLFPPCWYYKIPIENNPCHLSAKLGLYPWHINSHPGLARSPHPPINAHIPYIHTDRHTHTRPPTHTLKPHVWELLLQHFKFMALSARVRVQSGFCGQILHRDTTSSWVKRAGCARRCMLIARRRSCLVLKSFTVEEEVLAVWVQVLHRHMGFSELSQLLPHQMSAQFTGEWPVSCWQVSFSCGGHL